MIGPVGYALIIVLALVSTPFVGLLVRARHHPPVILPLIRSTPARAWLEAAAGMLVLGVLLVAMFAAMLVFDAGRS